MEKKREPLRYRPVAEADGKLWRDVGGLDEMKDAGCYIVQLRHGPESNQLPLEPCDNEHYIVATLIVTESGTADMLQKNRMIGQTLIMPDCDDGRTRIFNRTLRTANRNSMWNSWNNIAQTGVDNEITSTEELVASVTELVSETSNIRAALDTEKSTRETVDEGMKKSSVLVNSLRVDSSTSGVEITYSNVNGTEAQRVDIPAATTNTAGVIRAEDMANLIMSSNNDVAIYRPGLIAGNGDIIRKQDYSDGAYILRYTVFGGLSFTGHLEMAGAMSTLPEFHNIAILKGDGSLSRLLKYTDFNISGVTIVEGEKYICFSMPCAVGSYVDMFVAGGDAKGIRIQLDDEEKLKLLNIEDIEFLGTMDKNIISSLEDTIFVQSIVSELSVIPETSMQKTDLETDIIAGAYIDPNGILQYGDYGNVVVLKPGANTQYMHIKGNTGASTLPVVAYSTKENADVVVPCIKGDGVTTDIDLYIKPSVLYIYVYVGKRTFTFESIYGFTDTMVPNDALFGIDVKLDKKLDRKLGANLFDKDSDLIIKDTLLGFNNNTYTADYSKNFCVTHYIPIEAGKPYIGNYSSADNAIVLCVVDKTKTMVLLTINLQNGPEYRFTAPEGSAFVRMAIPMNRVNDFVFNEGIEVIKDAIYEDKPVYHSEVKVEALDAAMFPWKGKTIGMYGDSITALCGDEYVKENTWGHYLIDRLQAKGVVRGWGGTPLTHSFGYIEWFNSNGEHVPEGTEGSTKITAGGMCDWKRIITQFPESIKDSIDAVIIMGGTNDFRHHEIGDTEYFVRETLPDSTTGIDVDWFNSEHYTGGDFDITKVQGALCSTILKFQAWMPNAVIIVATQLSGYWLEQGVNGTHQLVSDTSGLTEGQFATKIAEAARYMSTPVIDINGLTGINQWNRKDYITDNVHPYTISGNKAMARVFIGGFKTIEPKF